MHFLLTLYSGTGRPSQLIYRGFTAVEMLVVLGIIAILAALAAPNFSPLINQWRVHQAVEGLKSTLYYARSEAIKRGGNIAIGKIAIGTDGCKGGGIPDADVDWSCGWVVRINGSANGGASTAASAASSAASNEDILQRFVAPANISIQRNYPAEASIEINRWGQISGHAVDFTLRPIGSADTDPAIQKLCMNLGGRIKVISANLTC